MSNVIQFPQKNNIPSQERDFEKRLHEHREGESALSLGATEHVADVSTGEQVEIDPVRFNSAYRIYKVLEKNFSKKDEAGRKTALAELQQSMGVDIDTTLPDTTVSQDELAADNVEPVEADPDSKLNAFLHDLAEKIYEALENCRETIAAIKPESIGSKTVSMLGEKGDANFILATGKGEKLYNELQSKDIGLKTVEKNDYGFVVKNDELDFKAVFVYQERLGGIEGEFSLAA